MASPAIIQQATASSASANALTPSLGTLPNAANSVLLLVSSEQTVQSVSGGLTFVGDISSGSLLLSLYRVVSSGPQSVTVQLNGTGRCAAWLAEVSNVGSLLFQGGATGTTLASSTADLPTTQLQVAGDIPIGAFLCSSVATSTPQAGWSEIAALNEGVGVSLEIQTGPVASGSQQAYTAEVTWSVTNPGGLAATVTISSAPPNALLSQEALELVSDGTPNSRTSQWALEALSQDTANSRTSQWALEALSQDTAKARMSQMVVEVLIQLDARLSQEVLETLASGSPHARVSQFVVEVIWSSLGARRRTIDDELMTF